MSFYPQPLIKMIQLLSYTRSTRVLWDLSFMKSFFRDLELKWILVYMALKAQTFLQPRLFLAASGMKSVNFNSVERSE
ncbi:hypothetical protein JL49_13910 [Pseudoalteromonas luteoviolacea]|uniref:Uncharacterized protein n=1 Tax=Pseudoalteromonas luteoviolacea NCIMB 1942 TaxID=1365253 RepID=A0A167A946_9GAMM|nr:hypothetical protein N482_15160 [Pseudoalteromonas luteoviolacea NCIMB 1942]KZX00006.1 hypothetical protein JL49_13910 [Pseudoalteromonas luteoviolacea]